MSYKPTAAKEKKIKSVYDSFGVMRDARKKKYKYFNDRTLLEYVNDSELRATSFVPTREEQGKEDWQANFFHPVTRNKLKAILASVALDIPDVRFAAQNERNQKSELRASIAKNLVNYSYDQNTNKQEDIYFEAWECAVKGTVHVYEGYQRTKMKRKFIKSYDPINGNIDFDEQEVVTTDECVNFIVPIENIYIWDFYIRNVQDQPRLYWVERTDPDSFMAEFGKYPDAEEVKTSVEITDVESEARFFKKDWENRVTADAPIEVIRAFDKLNDEFVIIANGVVLFDGPLLLGKKKKYYPFAKTIHEPFASDFYYGNSLPNSSMGEQDVINALFNSAVDKTYKSLVPPLLIGNTNKDDFDLEDEVITHDTKIYVQDINQVKPLESPTMKQADISMIDIISRGLDLTTVDANQQGVAGRGVTAREVVIANENAKKLRGVLYMFLTSLWKQKYELRLMNILTYYTKEKSQELAGVSGDNPLDQYRRFLVSSTDLSDGSTGTLGVTVVPDNTQLPTPEQLTARQTEYQSDNAGEPYEELAITSDYLDDWRYDIKVVPESVFQKDAAAGVAKMEQKTQLLLTAFPDYFQQNKKKLFEQTLISYNEDPEEYDLTPPPPMPVDPETGQPIPGGEAMMPGAETATVGTPTGAPPLTNMKQ